MKLDQLAPHVRNETNFNWRKKIYPNKQQKQNSKSKIEYAEDEQIHNYSCTLYLSPAFPFLDVLNWDYGP